MALCQPQVQARALSSRQQPSRSNTCSLPAWFWAQGKLLSPSCCFLEPSSPLDFQMFDKWNRTIRLWDGSYVPGFALLITFANLICWPASPDWAAEQLPKKKSFFSPKEGLLVPLLENYRHLTTWLWVFGIEINWIHFFCSHWEGKSPFI